MSTIIIKTPVFTLLYPALAKPVTPLRDGDGLPLGTPMYSCVAAFERGADLDRLHAMCQQTGEERFRDAYSFKTPFKQGRTMGKLDLSMYTLVTLKSKAKPYMRDAVREAESDEVYSPDDRTFIPGSLCTAEVQPFSYDSHGHRGVALALLMINKIADPLITEEEVAYIALPEDGTIPKEVL